MYLIVICLNEVYVSKYLPMFNLNVLLVYNVLCASAAALGRAEDDTSRVKFKINR